MSPVAKILFVNDEQDLGELVRMLLEDRGHDVQVLIDASRALEVTRREQPDLVILDWILDVVTGEAVIRQLRSDPQTARIPIALASAIVDLRRRAEHVDVCAALSKPYTGDELHRIVELALESGTG